jgi:hypothetical protein
MAVTGTLYLREMEYKVSFASIWWMMNCFPLMVSIRRESIGEATLISTTSCRPQAINHILKPERNLKAKPLSAKFIIVNYLYAKIQLLVMKIKLIGILFCFLPLLAIAQNKPKVMVMEIKDEIDPRMLRYVKLALSHAEKIKADYVIVDMDTYGGVLTDAKEIVDAIMDFKKPIWVFVNSDAASAGALISIACDSIYMSPGASIGAAQPKKIIVTQELQKVW